MWNWEYLLFSEHGLRFCAKDINICIIHRIILVFDLVKRSELGLRNHCGALVLNHRSALKVLFVRISKTHFDFFY